MSFSSSSDMSVTTAGQTEFFLQAYDHAVKNPCAFIIAATPDQADSLAYFLSQQSLDVTVFPDLELIPYDLGAISPDVIQQRYYCLNKMLTQKKWIVISSPFALAYPLRSKEYLFKDVISLKIGQHIDRPAMIESWVLQGYTSVSEVMQAGEFAVRGEIIDWFPIGHKEPLRLSIPEENLEQMRTFDPQTQRTLESLEHKISLPSSDFVLQEKDYQHIVRQFRRDFSDRKSTFYHKILSNHVPAGMTFFHPLMAQDGEKIQSCFELLKDRMPAYLLHPTAIQHHSAFLSKAEECFEQASIAYGFTPYSPKRIFCDTSIYNWTKTVSSKESVLNGKILKKPSAQELKEFFHMLQSSNHPVIYTVFSAPKAALLEQWLKKYNLLPGQFIQSFSAFHKDQHHTCWTIAPFEEIYCSPEGFWIIPYNALIHQILVIPQSSARNRASIRLQNHDPQLWSGIEYVVHDQHGIAKYHGLKSLTIDGQTQEFIELEYAENGRLYLPVDQVDALTPYQVGMESSVTLHKLGQTKWEREREKATQVALDHAADLLELYAKRAQALAFPHAIPETYIAFSQEFPFQETCDQERAIAEVMHDLTLSKPMDRLICGDVGFGKTEVALRACFISVMNKKQVAILAPTTLLAQQHYETLVERMSHWGISIALLTRNVKNHAQVRENIEYGLTQIVVGTHMLLQNTMKFEDLGLVIVDEEHRFGVSDKEKLKRMRGHVHLLSMTATPIPRTLSMSLQKLRDLSLIATPPLARRKIITSIHQSSHALIKQAIERELFRSGQVYFLCNDIAAIPKKIEMIQALSPNARVGFVHGQMPYHEMEHQMNLFYQHALDVLVCTTIIETGIDVAKAHAILIENAHEFGLAQLHQLRGRVGRSHHQAYAYCLIPMPFEKLSALAASRLEALTLYQDLGSGYLIAAHDLELRGAGEILGDKQSGHLQKIGLNYYQKLLDQASRQLSEPDLPDHLPLKLDFGVKPCLSDTQVPDPVLRLKIYRQWALATTSLEIFQLASDFEDRFGPFDRDALRWKNYHKLRVHAIELKISQIIWSKKELILAFHKSSKAGELCISWIQKGILKAFPHGPDAMAIKISTEHFDQRAEALDNFLSALDKGQNLSHNWLTLKQR